MKKIRNEAIFENMKISYNIYLEWCVTKKKNPDLPKNRKEFFKLMLDGKLIKEGKDLINKRGKRNESFKKN